VDNNIPYPTLLRLEWDFENLSMVNLKKRQLVLEQGDLRVIAPLDPKDGKRYVETIKGGMEIERIDIIYKATAHTEDYINPTTNGVLSWRGISSCYSDSEEGIENWQQRLHELSAMIYARITRTLRWIGTEVCELPLFDGLGNVDTFFMEFEGLVIEPQRRLALDVALSATPARW